jgi:PAS domain S-box-containing protein
MEGIEQHGCVGVQLTSRQSLRRTDLGRTRPIGETPEDGLHLAAIADALSDPVVGALDGRIRSWNAGAEQLFGYRAEEIVGKPVSILYPPERIGELEEILSRLRRGEAISPFETVRRRKDGTDVQVLLSISPVRCPSGEIVGTAIVHDISDRKRREEIPSFLAEASRLLAVNLDYHETLPRVADLTLANLADWCLVETRDAAGSFTQIAVAHRDQDKAELAREMLRLYPPEDNDSSISLRVLRTGKAELIPEVSDTLLKNIAQNADHLRMLRELGLRSLVVVPLRVRGRVLGTILLANAKAGRRFNGEDLDLAEDLARRAALAIDNAMLHKSEKEARTKAERAAARIGRLQAVTASLSRAATPAAVAEVLVNQGAAAVGADGGFVRLLTADGRQLKLTAAAGMSEHFVRSHGTLPLLSPLPDAEVFRTGEERYFESVASARAASPEFARAHQGIGHEAVAFVPFTVQARTIGLMALGFSQPRIFADDDRELLRTLAGQCAQAIERARLYEAERKARAEAELAIERTTRLQSLANDLAEALTPADVAEVVVTQGIASVEADAGALQLLTDDGKTLEIVSGQGSDRTLVEAGWRRLSTDLKLPSTDALHRREPVFIESEKDLLENYPHLVENYPWVLDAGAGLRARSGAHIPLVVSGRPLGVLFLGFTRPREFSDSQRLFALALARQCAQAIGRTQIYEAELEGRVRLSRLVEGLHEGVVSVNRRGSIEFANSTAKQMLSPAPLEEGSRVPEAWLGFALRRFAADLFEADELVVEAQVLSQDGARAFEVTGIPGGSDAALLVFHDVSERERRERAEREFVANAAHELRTPLAAITSATERLQGGAREVPQKRDRFIGHIQHESARLNRLASSLLVLARAQTREEEPRRQEIQLRELLEELVGELELNPGVELVLDCPPNLVARSNRDLLEHALLNLAGNAARHTERGQVRVSVSVDDGGLVIIEVNDTGAGFPADQLSRVFDRFYRGPGQEGSAGFGLGLPITRDAVEAIGGRVEIDSVLGVGTTARIVLPCSDVPDLA